MDYKYNIGDTVNIKSTITATAEVISRWHPDTQEVNLYQLKVLDGSYKDGLYWFAEHEISK